MGKKIDQVNEEEKRSKEVKCYTFCKFTDSLMNENTNPHLSKKNMKLVQGRSWAKMLLFLAMYSRTLTG